MNKAFEEIALIPGLIAAALVAPDGTLTGWCANSAIPSDRLAFIGVTCRSLLSATRAEQREAHIGWACFGPRTLVFREEERGLFLAYLDSTVNDAVLDWLFAQIDALLTRKDVPEG